MWCKFFLHVLQAISFWDFNLIGTGIFHIGESYIIAVQVFQNISISLLILICTSIWPNALWLLLWQGSNDGVLHPWFLIPVSASSHSHSGNFSLNSAGIVQDTVIIWDENSSANLSLPGGASLPCNPHLLFFCSFLRGKEFLHMVQVSCYRLQPPAEEQVSPPR